MHDEDDDLIAGLELDEGEFASGEEAKASIRKLSKPQWGPEHWAHLEKPAFSLWTPEEVREKEQLTDRAIEAAPRFPLSQVYPFEGEGIYLLYYQGDLPIYAPLVERGGLIYVGKGTRGDRKGRKDPGGFPCWGRLRDHKRSILEVEAYARRRGVADLRVVDFECKFVVTSTGGMHDAGPKAIESYLIDKWKPLWNVVLTGFGTCGTYHKGQPLSWWDTKHQGRKKTEGHRLDPMRSSTVDDLIRMALGGDPRIFLILAGEEL